MEQTIELQSMVLVSDTIGLCFAVRQYLYLVLSINDYLLSIALDM
jgi:hypothetical protein